MQKVDKLLLSIGLTICVWLLYKSLHKIECNNNLSYILTNSCDSIMENFCSVKNNLTKKCIYKIEKSIKENKVCSNFNNFTCDSKINTEIYQVNAVLTSTKIIMKMQDYCHNTLNNHTTKLCEYLLNNVCALNNTETHNLCINNITLQIDNEKYCELNDDIFTKYFCKNDEFIKIKFPMLIIFSIGIITIIIFSNMYITSLKHDVNFPHILSNNNPKGYTDFTNYGTLDI